MHNDYVDFCDLRWGVNTMGLDPEKGCEKVLEVCLDEIDRSDPPMVVILGYHYGWIPDSELIRLAASRKALQLEDLEYSVTALEIEYGALCDPAKAERTLFYFREIEGMAPEDYLEEDAVHAEKLKALKERILTAVKGNVKTYTVRWNGQGFDGMKEFAEKLAADVKDKLMPEWASEDRLSPYERERNTHEAFVLDKAKRFHARKADAEKLFALAIEQPVTIIEGAAGSGKSTLFCHLAKQFSEAGMTVLPFISGLTKEAGSIRGIVESITYWLEDQLNLPHLKEESDPETGEPIRYAIDEWRRRMAKLYTSFAERDEKLMVMIDAADQLLPCEEGDNFAFIPNVEDENIHFMMTCTPGMPVQGRDTYMLEPIGEKDKRAVIAGALAPGRELSSTVMEAILDLKTSDNLLYLSFLVQRLQMMDRKDFTAIRASGDNMAAIEKRQMQLLKTSCPDGLEDMSMALLNEAGMRIHPHLAHRAAEYIALSRRGLRRQDLAALLGEYWSDLDFSHLINYMHDCFLLRTDGRYDFAHNSLRSGFLKNVSDKKTVHRELMSYLQTLPKEDPVQIADVFYHSIKADDKAEFVEMIKSGVDSWKYLHLLNAANDLCMQTKEDNGVWAADLIRSLGDSLADKGLQFFFRSVFIYSFSDNKHEQKLCRNTYEMLINESDILCIRDSSRPNWEFLDYCCNTVADILMRQGEPEDLDRAKALFQKSITIREQFLQEKDSFFDLYNLSVCYLKYASVYEEIGGRENLDRALEFCQKAVEIREALAQGVGEDDDLNDLGGVYVSLASIYETMGGRENLESARNYYRRSLNLRKQILLYRETSQDLERVLFNYLNLANINIELDDGDDLDQALEYSKESYKLAERLMQERGNTDDRRNLMSCSAQLARIYVMRSNSGDLELAKNHCKRALTLARQLANELDTLQAHAALDDIKRDILEYGLNEIEIN